MVRMTQFQFIFRILILETLNSILTLMQLVVFILAKNKLIRKESFMVESEVVYFLILNVIPIFLIFRVIRLKREVDEVN